MLRMENDTKDRGKSLVLWLKDGEKAVITAAARKAKQRFSAPWARALILEEAERVLGKAEYERLMSSAEDDKE